MALRLQNLPELSGFDVVVAVPLHPRRLRQRGYNQAEILAREVARLSGLPMIDALERRRGNGPSWRLTRPERQTELADAFGVKENSILQTAGRRILLIDDACATGTTLEECAIALRRAGARDVAALTFTRA